MQDSGSPSCPRIFGHHSQSVEADLRPEDIDERLSDDTVCHLLWASHSGQLHLLVHGRVHLDLARL